MKFTRLDIIELIAGIVALVNLCMKNGSSLRWGTCPSLNDICRFAQTLLIQVGGEMEFPYSIIGLVPRLHETLPSQKRDANYSKCLVQKTKDLSISAT